MATITYTAARKIIAAHTQAELVTNGDFASGTGWTTGTGWAIAAGKATHTSGSAGDLSRALSITAGVQYIVTYTVSTRTTGTITAKLGTTAGAVVSANGAVSEYITANNTTLYFSASSTFDGSIDDVSVKLTDTWVKEFDLTDMAPFLRSTTTPLTSLNGTTRTRGIRQETGWTATTEAFDVSGLSAWKELFASVGYGETFTFDPYGTAAAPDNPVSVILEGDISIGRITKNYHRISFAVREI